MFVLCLNIEYDMTNKKVNMYEQCIEKYYDDAICSNIISNRTKKYTN